MLLAFNYVFVQTLAILPARALYSHSNDWENSPTKYQGNNENKNERLDKFGIPVWNKKGSHFVKKDISQPTIDAYLETLQELNHEFELASSLNVTGQNLKVSNGIKSNPKPTQMRKESFQIANIKTPSNISPKDILFGTWQQRAGSKWTNENGQRLPSIPYEPPKKFVTSQSQRQQSKTSKSNPSELKKIENIQPGLNSPELGKPLHAKCNNVGSSKFCNVEQPQPLPGQQMAHNKFLETKNPKRYNNLVPPNPAVKSQNKYAYSHPASAHMSAATKAQQRYNYFARSEIQKSATIHVDKRPIVYHKERDPKFSIYGVSNDRYKYKPTQRIDCQSSQLAKSLSNSKVKLSYFKPISSLRASENKNQNQRYLYYDDLHNSLQYKEALVNLNKRKANFTEDSTTSTLQNITSTLYSTSSTLDDTTSTLHDTTSTLHDNASTLHDNSSTLQSTTSNAFLYEHNQNVSPSLK